MIVYDQYLKTSTSLFNFWSWVSDKLLSFLHHTFDNLFFQDENGEFYDAVKAYIEITDTSGHRDFEKSLKNSIKRADGVIFVFGNNDQYSLRRIKE